MMAHAEATRDMDPKTFLGNLILLIVGGNDTTRNSLSGGLYALNENPHEYQKLRNNHALVDSHGARNHPLGRRRSRICAAPRWKIPNCAANKSRRATRS